ncbi:MAG: DUF2341 domain-containing protein [Phycisphaerae bacterium]
MSKTACCVILLLGIPQTASAQYDDWRHSGSLYVLTTPEGADLPAASLEKGFPLLIRLHKDFFDFKQAGADGQDIRFSASDGTPLPYQIDQWDPAGAAAAVWVRLPTIKGNARQEIRMHWGKPGATSESNGAAVFNAANGYLSVWHMGGNVTDAVGTLESKDTGTTASAGIIGESRHLPGGKGVNCGEKNTGYPTGAAPHSSEAWFRAEKPNATILAWGNEKAQGKVVVKFASPPHVRTDCYFSNGNIRGGTRLAMGEWCHVMHTYTSGDSRIYVNGVLDGVNTHRSPPMAIRTPARLYIGGWYNNYRFVGDIDEVRVSKVARSADWVKLQYENQKPMQTLVGPLVRPGNTLSVSTDRLSVPEGKTATVTAKADGAQKIYWILKRGGKDTVVAVDRSEHVLHAGRVTDDQSWVLQLKAVYADEVRTRDIRVTVKEEIPEPVFTLHAPAKWNGRDTIEVVPAIRNLKAMTAKGADNLNYTWTISGGAVIKQVVPGRLVLKRSQCSGRITVALALGNGGGDVAATTSITVTEPERDAWVQRTPGADEKPQDNQFYARDDRNEGTLYCNGALDKAADSVFLKVYADDKLITTLKQKPTPDKGYAFTVKLKPGLIKYRVECGAMAGGTETILHTAGNMVCGDAYLIDGQSNALATDTREQSPRETHDWIRSYARPRHYRKGEKQNLWCNPVWKAQREHKAELGWWGMELAKRLVASQKVPIFIVNGAVGGTRIDQHQRSGTDPTDLETIYGRMLWRVREAKLTHGVRAVIWHQGESDQGADGPDGGYGWESYQRYFVDMSAAWKQDFPNIRHYYIFQIWPNSCSMGNGNGDMLREVLRTLPRLYSNMDVMSTLGITPPGPAHFPLTGWAEFARLIQPLIERDSYGATFTEPITPPDLKRAYYTSDTRDAIALEFDQPVVWKDPLIGQFYLDGEKEKVASGAVAGNVITLKLKAASAASRITYLHEMSWSQKNLLIGANGIAALTFCNVPVLNKGDGR